MIEPLALWTGVEVPVPELAITMHQPSIEEIAYAGEAAYSHGSTLLCINKNSFEKGEDNSNTFLENASNFNIFMEVINDARMADRKKDVITTLTLLFPNYKAMFTPRGLVLLRKEDNQSIMIDENNFDVLQEYIKDVTCYRENENDDYNPQDDKAREIAEKLKRGRARVAAQKAAENKTASALTQYVSALMVGTHMSYQDIKHLTVYGLYDLLERMRLFTEWDIDIRAKLAGASGDKEVENWMKNIH